MSKREDDKPEDWRLEVRKEKIRVLGETHRPREGERRRPKDTDVVLQLQTRVYYTGFVVQPSVEAILRQRMRKQFGTTFVFICGLGSRGNRL